MQLLPFREEAVYEFCAQVSENTENHLLTSKGLSKLTNHRFEFV